MSCVGAIHALPTSSEATSWQVSQSHTLENSSQPQPLILQKLPHTHPVSALPTLEAAAATAATTAAVAAPSSARCTSWRCRAVLPSKAACKAQHKAK